MSSARFELGTSPTVGDNDEASCFDCNICLENACDPIVTTCGHLYCWPCICRWSQAQNACERSMATTAQQDWRMIDCPVCRNVIDMKHSLIPLYSGGSSSRPSSFHKDGTVDDIPLRPSHALPSRTFGANTESNLCFGPAIGIARRRNGRSRRVEQKLETSLNMVSVFLLYCTLMCLLLF